MKFSSKLISNSHHPLKFTIRSQIKNLFLSEGFKKYALNTGWLFAEQILRIFSGLFVGVWVARYLGPELFGTYSYAISFVAIFGAIANLGLQGIVVRDILNKPEQQKSIMGTAFYMQIIGALFATLAISVVLPFTSNDSTTNFYILIIASGLLFQSFLVIDYYFQAKVLSKYVSICRLIQLAASSSLKIYFVLTNADLIYFFLIIVLDNITLSIALLFAYQKHGNFNFYKYFEKKIFKYLLKESWPLIISGLVVMIYMRIDQIMIKEMMDAKSVGIYSAAVRLSEVWYFVPMIISQSLFPAIINSRKMDRKIFLLRLKRLFNLMTVISLIAALFITFSSEVLIIKLFGLSFKDAAEVLIIHVWAGIFISSAIVSGKWLTIEGNQKFIMYRHVAGAFLNIILNFIFIPLFGIKGAAISTLITYFFSAVLMNVFNIPTREIFFMQIKSILSLGIYGNKFYIKKA